MKKGALNFLGRKNQSLFDTNRPLQIQEMENGFPENLELMLDSSAIPDTGTAKVRSRPTVKHYIPSSEGVHGFAVPTPTVPLFPMFDAGRSDGSDGDRLSNGSLLSLSDRADGDFFVPPPPSQAAPPPPPSQAPPPPPAMFVLPPPDFLGELDSPTKAMFARPTMAPPKPPSQPPPLQDLTLLRPPTMTPPKPPSITSSVSTPNSTPPPSMVPGLPDCPTFAPPKPPPTEKHLRSAKTPPPKPTRLSSMSSFDGPPPPGSPGASVQTSTPSSFNPQNTAKLYNAPKTSVLSGNGDSDARPKQILLLQDSTPEAVKVNGNALPTLPFKPVRGAAQGTQPEPQAKTLANVAAKTSPVQPKSEAKAVASRLLEKSQPPPLPDVPPKFRKEPTTPEPFDVAKLADSASRKGSYSPLIDRKLRSLKGPETSRDGAHTSPLALLQAAKEREKHRSTGSRDSSPRSSVKHRNSAPNSFVVTPRSNSVSSAVSRNGEEVDSPFSAAGPASTTVQTQALHTAPPLVRAPAVPSTPAPSGPPPAATAQSFGRLASDVRPAPPSVDYRRSQASPTETPMELLPPPPEFANFSFGDSVDGPPDFPPPDPPSKKAPVRTSKPFHAAAAPSPPPKHAAPSQPQPRPPAPVREAKPQVSLQTLSRVPAPKPLPAVSESQATLQSILQRKMQEMDHKMIPKREVESSNDEWGSPMSDEDHKIPSTPRSTPQSYKNYTLPVKNANLDMRELETKVAKKQQDVPSASTNGTPQKQHGMTFTVRPGTKQPITLVSKGEPS